MGMVNREREIEKWDEEHKREVGVQIKNRRAAV